MSTNFIKNDELTLAFKHHLKISDNNRIIFSGPFGIGKSSFLKNYFDEASDKYNVIHLYPVNYSIASNEDILSLLQYDIIYELLAKPGVKLEKEDFNKIEILQWFGIENFDELFFPLLEFIPKVGKPLVEFLKVLKKYEEFKFNVKSGDAENLEELKNAIEGKEGSIYRQDAYLEFINRSLEKLKKSKKSIEQKKNILIIDDLDRIDPEHIFRLFNVFAAHFDLTSIEAGNKFGFDQVIFVCDIENIKEIFHHKYGVSTKFTGYIDKFYSVCIFYVDNKSALQYYINSNLERSHNYVNHLLIDILIKMVEAEVINFRNIKNSVHWNSFASKKSKYDKQLYFTEIARVLSMISGDAGALIKNLESCIEILSKRNSLSIGEDTEMVRNYFKVILIPAFDFKYIESSSEVSKHFNMIRLNNMGGTDITYHVIKNPDGKISIELDRVVEGVDKFLPLYPYTWKLIIESVRLLKTEGVLD
jgi:hypothetical protein